MIVVPPILVPPHMMRNTGYDSKWSRVVASLMMMMMRTAENERDERRELGTRVDAL